MYIRFTEQEKQEALEADIVTLLMKNGLEVKRAGSEYMWMYGDEPVSIKHNLWFNHYEQVGGNTIDFVKKYYGLNYTEAVRFILGEFAGEELSFAGGEHHPKANVKFELPSKNENNNRAYAYLEKERGLDRSVIYPFVKWGLIYESEMYHNIVFVGKDKNGIPKHAHKKGSGKANKYRMNQAGSDMRYTFNWRGISDTVYVFEAPIDMLSYINLHRDKWYEDTYIAACSVSDKSLMQLLRENSDIKQIYICFDNDGPGQESARKIQERLFTSGYHVEILVPDHKDWNEDLLSLRQEVGDEECLTESLALS